MKLRKCKALIQICRQYFLTHLHTPLSWEPVSLSFRTARVGLDKNKTFIAMCPLGGDLSLLPPTPLSPIHLGWVPKPRARSGRDRSVGHGLFFIAMPLGV